MSAGILPYDRIGNRGFESSDSFPFARGPDITAGANLVQSLVDFEAMAVGIKKLHGDLTTRAAPPFKRDCRTLFAQPFAHVEDFGERSNLESNVMQLCMGGIAPRRSRPAQSNDDRCGSARTQSRRAADLRNTFR
jgi:hypothetical protein